MGELDKKRELIVESAIKRFSHFGIQKTTMNEIADDISVTQPALYYYFPDKMTLVIAVVERIMNQYFEELHKCMDGLQSLDEEFYCILTLRKKFMERYFMLKLTEATQEVGQIHDSCQPIMKKAHIKEAAFVTGLLEKAVNNGSISKIDPHKMSGLYIDVLTGLSMFVFITKNKKLFPGNEEFEAILTKQEEFTKVFISGLKTSK
ncbi:TetR/AcrR family transcriptional regulator [Arcticibacter eurypsychrophilus]|uniref:TetR/AcrR family transcriptional regulator n=1 Tax=Arcticibacter eurypsychrophilus TaxID=1434752 RepID=UPI00084DCDF6|nr:TetR/AcrR family transcriptional regulator [Arcticibacter eurypsychrophilus]